MKTGLLADLVLMMSSSPEDVATRAVELLLRRSTAARSAVNRLLVEWRGQPGPSVGRWVSQVVGQDNGRTDLEGYAAGDQVLAIFENKFWAGLTDNQPGTYLRRLPESEGVLAFVAPATRVSILAHELGLRLPTASASAVFAKAGQSHVAHLPDGKSIVVTSWTVLLEVMADAMDAAGEAENRADLRQLQSLVDRMDLEGFRPFSITDLTSDTPRLIMRLCGLTDSVAQAMLTRPYVNRRGLRASAGQGWYGHYLKIHGFGCQLIVSAPFWAERGLSPLWFRASSADWKFQESIRPLLASVVSNESWMFEERTTGWQGHWVPLRVAEGREREAVVRDLVAQVEAIAAQLAVHAQAELEVPPSDEAAAVAPPSPSEPS